MATIAMSTDLSVLDKYNELIEQSLGSNSVYIRTKETLDALVKDGDLSGPEKANVIGNVLGSLNTSIVNSSMSTALQWVSAEKELTLKKYELEKQLGLLQEEIDLLQTQDSEMLLNGVKQREQVAVQTIKLQEEIDLLQTQDSEMQLNGTKQREQMNAQTIKLQEEIDLLQTQDSEMQLNGTNDRSVKNRQVSVTEAKQSDTELTSAKNRNVLDAQEALYKRQKAGFDDNKHQKILDTQMNAWGITFQDTDTTFIPRQIGQTEFDTSFTATRQDYDV